MSRLPRGTPTLVGTFAALVGGMVMYITDPEARKYVNERVLPYRNRWVDRTLQHRKADLLCYADGHVVDIDAETGANAQYFNPYRTTGLTAVETDSEFTPYLKQCLKDTGYPDPVIVTASSLDYLRRQPTASLQTVVSTMSLSKHEDAEPILDEIRRVLRPDGKYIFIEHSSFPGTRETQEAWSKLVHPITGLHLHPVADLLTQKFGPVYLEDWSGKTDRRAPRANVDVMLTPAGAPLYRRPSPALLAPGSQLLHAWLKKDLADTVGPTEASAVMDPLTRSARTSAAIAHPARAALAERVERGLVPWSLRPVIAGYALHPAAGATAISQVCFSALCYLVK